MAALRLAHAPSDREILDDGDEDEHTDEADRGKSPLEERYDRHDGHRGGEEIVEDPPAVPERIDHAGLAGRTLELWEAEKRELRRRRRRVLEAVCADHWLSSPHPASLADLPRELCANRRVARSFPCRL